MMPTERFERQLPELLTELAAPRTPDYFDDLFGLTARTRQRPAWTFLERWLPMVDIARQPLSASRLPLRTIGLGLLLVALILAAVAAFVVGTRRDLPAPFGPARNGLVAYAKDGDIYTADPVTGVAVPVVTGPETDLRPAWSLDGSRFAFERRVDSATGPGLLYVAEADGTDLIQLTPDALRSIESYAFSPDGREIVFTARPTRLFTGLSTLFIAKSDGSSAPRTLSVGTLSPSSPTYHPPDGGEIAFIGQEPGVSASGLYAVKPDGTGLRTLVEPSDLVLDNPRWSPDGTRLSYTAWAVDLAAGPLARPHIISADGQTDRILRTISENDLEGLPNAWSNDATRLLIGGCYTTPADPTTCSQNSLAVVPADGNSPEVTIDVAGGFPGAEGASYVWAPDDGSILATPLDAQGQPMPGSLLLDPMTGRSRPVPWSGAADPAWQRLAP